MCSEFWSVMNRFGREGTGDVMFRTVEGRVGQSFYTTARHNSESLFSLGFALQSSPFSSPLACPLSTFFLVLKLIVFYHHKDTWF